MQVTIILEHDCGLIRQGTRAANVLLRNPGAVQPLQHTEHPKQPPVRAQQGHGQKLMHLMFRHYFNVDPGSSTGLVGPEHFLGSQRFRGNSLGKRRVYPPWLPSFDSVTNLKLVILQQRNEASPETQEARGSYHKSLQEVFEIATGAEFRG